MKLLMLAILMAAVHGQAQPTCWWVLSGGVILCKPASELPAGPPGAKGDTGPQGVPGSNGLSGLSSSCTLSAGETPRLGIRLVVNGVKTGQCIWIEAISPDGIVPVTVVSPPTPRQITAKPGEYIESCWTGYDPILKIMTLACLSRPDAKIFAKK